MRFFIIYLLSLLTTTPQTQSTIDRAIVHLLTKGFPKHDIQPRPNHPLIKDVEKRGHLVDGIEKATQKYTDIDPFLMVAIAFREGSFIHTKVGTLEEKSTFQMVKAVVKTVQRIEPQCTLKTYEGSALCCAAWLDFWSKNCKKKSIKSAISIYAGSSCTPPNEKVKWIINDRLAIAKLLKSVVTQ